MDRSVTTKTLTDSSAAGYHLNKRHYHFETKPVRSARVWHKPLQFWKASYKLRLPKGGDRAAPMPKRQWSLACPYPYPSWAQRAQPCCTLQSAPLLTCARHVAATAQIVTFALHEASHSSLLSPGAYLCQKPPDFLPRLEYPWIHSYHVYLPLTHITAQQLALL